MLHSKMNSCAANITTRKEVSDSDKHASLQSYGMVIITAVKILIAKASEELYARYSYLQLLKYFFRK